jgi:TonB-linked SusC/RagA family outer membrane protein
MQKNALCDPNAVVLRLSLRAANPGSKTRLLPQRFRLLTKTLLIMKFFILFMMAGLLKVQANGYAQTVTFSGKNVAITRVFKTIEAQTGYTVFANKDVLKGIKPVSAAVQDMPLQSFLTFITKDQPVGYEIHNRTIFIVAKKELPAEKKEEKPELVYAEVKGVVTADGGPLAGATVSIKGTNISTVTNGEGRFTIAALPGQILVFSYVGYKSQEVTFNTQATVDITLEKLVAEEEHVVVTALGIPKRVRSLTYGVQEIKSTELNAVNNGNFVNSLAGKVAGATINTSSSGDGSSARVILRGVKSISGNNNALFVVDGIPLLNNTIRGQAEDIFSGAGQTGDILANLNPDDIESLTILSGPSAAALYGSLAANGVIVINTKKGQKNQTSFSVANTTAFSSPLVLPKFQNTYGATTPGSYYSWGDKLSTPSSYKPTDFFQTGVNSATSVSFSTGGENSQTYVSVAKVDANGIIPNNEFGRLNFTVRNTSAFLNGKMNLDVSFSAGLVDEQNMISQGQYFNPLMAVYLFPAGDDFNKVKAFERYNASRNLMTQSWHYGDNGLMMQNPYWVTERNLFVNKKERYAGTVALKYNINDWMNLSGRVKLDKSNDRNEKKFAASTNTLFASDYGYYSLQNMGNRQVYADALLNVNKTISRDYSIAANLGISLEDVRFDENLYGGRLQTVANLYTFGNITRGISSDISQTGYIRQKQSVFGTAQLGYQNKLFLDLTGRNDWASTLAGVNKKSFFYSSAGLSAIVTDLLDIRSRTLNYLKMRISYAGAGNEPNIFLTIPTYPLAGGSPGTDTRMQNPNLKPELTKSWEAGLNAVLFNNTLRVEATVYSSRTYNQFFQPTLTSTSGSETVIVNGGRIDNKGIEATVRYTKNFGAVGWTSSLTYSLNKNKVVELLRDWKNPLTGEITSLNELNMSGTGSYKMVLKEGGTMGDIYVNTLRVDEHGAIYVDPGSQKVVPENGTFVYAGTNLPKYNLGWGNTITWKGISLNALVSLRVGGVVVSNTQAMMDAFGVSQASADARDNGGALVNGRPIPAREFYETVGAGGSGGIASLYTYSATNARLAELALSYQLPLKRFNKFIKGANVGIVGRNLFMFYREAPFDPELTANTQTYFQGIDYFMMPSLRSVGFSVKLNF